MQLARWGLLDRIAAAGTPPVRRTVFHYGDTCVEVPIKPGRGFHALYAPRRTVLDPILVDAARAAGAEVRFGVTVTALCRDRNGRVTGVVGRDDSGAPFGVAARITVGADGMGSTIARLAGAPVDRAGTSAAAFIYGHWDGLGVDGYELFYRPGVSAGLFPTNNGKTCVFVCTTPQRFRSESSAGMACAYARLLGDAAPRLSAPVTGARAPERLRIFTGRPGHLRRASGPGWALVGDAGYFKDPITAHGITDALRDAELLARSIITATTATVPEAIALAAYQATRDRLSEQLFAITDDIASFAWNLERIPTLLIELSESMNDEVAWLTELESVAAAA
jgi:flavin-dependent dehydrogenase